MQLCREYFYLVMIKNLLEIMLLSIILACILKVLVSVLLVWDSRIQKANHSLLLMMKDQQTNPLTNIFREYLQIELSINIQSETLKLQFQKL